MSPMADGYDYRGDAAPTVLRGTKKIQRVGVIHTGTGEVTRMVRAIRWVSGDGQYQSWLVEVRPGHSAERIVDIDTLVESRQV